MQFRPITLCLAAFVSSVAFSIPSSVLAATADGVAGAGFDVIAYRLALTPDVAGKTVAGRETIELTATVDGLRHLVFTANALTIEDATVDGATAAVESSQDGLAVCCRVRCRADERFA